MMVRGVVEDVLLAITSVEENLAGDCFRLIMSKVLSCYFYFSLAESCLVKDDVLIMYCNNQFAQVIPNTHGLVKDD